MMRLPYEHVVGLFMILICPVLMIYCFCEKIHLGAENTCCTVLGDGDAYGQWMFDENGGQCLSMRGKF